MPLAVIGGAYGRLRQAAFAALRGARGLRRGRRFAVGLRPGLGVGWRFATANPSLGGSEVGGRKSDAATERRGYSAYALHMSHLTRHMLPSRRLEMGKTRPPRNSGSAATRYAPSFQWRFPFNAFWYSSLLRMFSSSCMSVRQNVSKKFRTFCASFITSSVR